MNAILRTVVVIGLVAVALAAGHLDKKSVDALFTGEADLISLGE